MLFTPSSLSYKIETDITTLTIVKPAWMELDGGQYFFVNIPEISLSEWHPLSHSGSLNGDIVFRVKNQAHSPHNSSLRRVFAIGAAQSNSTFVSCWTGHLATIAEKMQFQEIPMPMVRLHGPFGYAPFLEFDMLLLFAGGIGITPFMSVIIDIYSAISQGKPIPTKQVSLVWMAQETELFRMYEDVYEAISDLQKSFEAPMFFINLFCTRSPAPIQSSGAIQEDGISVKTLRPGIPLATGNGIALNYGRCKFEEMFTKFSRSGSTLAAVCGPPMLVQEVSHLARLFECEFHSEEFTF